VSVRKKNIKTQKVGELTEFLERAKEIRKQWSPDDHAELRTDRFAIRRSA
jgi:hypothetical protein